MPRRLPNIRVSRRGRIRRPGRRNRRARSRARRGIGPQAGARARLRSFRQASILAVALTGVLLLVFAPDEAGVAQEGDTSAVVAEAVDTLRPAAVRAIPDTARAEVRPDSLARAATEEATGTIRDIGVNFIGYLPKFLIAFAVLFIAWLLVRLIRPLLRRALGRWERADAFTAVFGVVIWLLGIGIAISVLAGDLRALLGSIGLVGLALSWALQTPIESFTGWLLNGFQGYYRVGDRIAVGEVFGDVYRIDILTTTVWEYGGHDHSGIGAEQPTGRLITFPNNEVLTGTVINYTRDFPYVWDELAVGMAPESDVHYSLGMLARIAEEVLGDYMVEPARRYEAILRRTGLEGSIATAPQIFVSLEQASWVDYTIRYLVATRERRRWKSALSARLLEEMQKPEHTGKVLPVYPRQQVQFIRPDGMPTDAEWMRPGD